MSGGELCLLQHEVDEIEKLSDIMLDNDVCKAMIRDSNTEYETPGIKEIEGEMWKGKADIINHNEKLVIDLKTTNDIQKFKWSASKFNYDSQAYIYSELFGYEMVFIVIDKNTGQLGIFDCSPEFYAKGQDKVQRAVDAYRLFYKNKDFDPKQTGLETSVNNFYKNQTHVKAVDNLRRTTGATKEQLQRMFNQINQYV
jgi:hypothetical protein